jgi:multidrug efflux pump subunit AcrA (membrane-fusion protein)
MSRLGPALACALLGAACTRAADPDLIRASGHVEATQVRLSAKVGGRLAEIKVREGDAVEAGQELARIDTVDLELLLRQARGATRPRRGWTRWASRCGACARASASRSRTRPAAGRRPSRRAWPRSSSN